MKTKIDDITVLMDESLNAAFANAKITDKQKHIIFKSLVKLFNELDEPCAFFGIQLYGKAHVMQLERQLNRLKVD